MSHTIVSCLVPGFELDGATMGLLGEGERLAHELGGRHVVVVAAVCDADERAELARRCDSVLVLAGEQFAEYQTESCLAALSEVCQSLAPTAVFLADSTYSQEVTPRLAHRLGGSSASDGQAVAWRDERVCITRSVYGGKAEAVVRLNKSPAVVWLRARSFEPAVRREAGGEVEERTLASPTQQGSLEATVIDQRHEEMSQGVRLEDAQIIVSGGRGLGGPEPFEALRGLASALGAEVAASRAACDAGWVPPNWQVGQTGKKVAPQLYLAVAISGASQHLMGIADSKVIAAINTDADAPIFKHCSFGLVEDYRKVIGPLSERLASILTS